METFCVSWKKYIANENPSVKRKTKQIRLIFIMCDRCFH